MECILYAEGMFDQPINIYKGLNELNTVPTRYYMQTKKICSSEHVIKGDKIYVPFNWENVLQLGNKKQQAAFNKFRNEYVHELVIGYCEKNGCNPVPVGSAAISARSDIDFNMYSENKDVDYVIMQINKIHRKRFLDSMEELFDVNIYGTVVDIFDELLCGVGKCISLKKDAVQKQHVWAFLRAAEYIRDYANGFVFSEKHQEIYNECLTLSKKLSGKKQLHSIYLKNIKIYLSSVKTEKDPAKLAQIYGKTKYYERETYRSVGATLHIVMKKKGLPVSLLQDSVYDNFGFAAEVLLTKSICTRYRKDTKVYKTCKYIARICDALENMKKDFDGLQELKNFCESMNIRRKRMLPFLSSDFKKLCKIIGSPIKFEPVRFLQAIYDFLLV